MTTIFIDGTTKSVYADKCMTLSYQDSAAKWYQEDCKVKSCLVGDLPSIVVGAGSAEFHDTLFRYLSRQSRFPKYFRKEFADSTLMVVNETTLGLQVQMYKTELTRNIFGKKVCKVILEVVKLFEGGILTAGSGSAYTYALLKNGFSAEDSFNFTSSVDPSTGLGIDRMRFVEGGIEHTTYLNGVWEDIS